MTAVDITIHPPSGRSGCRCPDFPFLFERGNPDQTDDLRSDMTDSSTERVKTVLHPVAGLATAKAVYSALLGAEPRTGRLVATVTDPDGNVLGLLQDR
jgi:hypothetical protein